ncbi:MAG: AcrR family transcriptional regulator [Candidatus Azotimanducaceae bacterium]|jgi:AcrR family transcriptional regulator
MRILEISREQMNLCGVHNVSTNHICALLDISPGNLYYHFKNREQIVSALFSDLEVDFRASFKEETPTPITATDFSAYYIRTLDVAWKHRFFFSNLLYLLRKDPALASDYRKLQSWALNQLEGIVRQLASEGHLQVRNRRQLFRSLATNTWLIWSNWIRHLEISRDAADIERRDMIEGVEQIFDVMSGYLSPEFEASARKHLQKELKKANQK